MNNLTTRKIVLGMLMALVLVFSVQGIADALTFATTRTGHLGTVSTDGKFEIQFTVNLLGDSPIHPNIGAVLTTDSAYNVDTRTHYIDINGNGIRDTTPISESAMAKTSAYFYDEEKIRIVVSGPGTINKIGVHDRTVTDGNVELWEGRLRTGQQELPEGAITVMGTAGSTAGPITITISDITPAASVPIQPITSAQGSNDYPGGNTETATSLTFTIYVVANHSVSSAGIFTSAVDSTAYGHNIPDLQIGGVTGNDFYSANLNFELRYSIVGPGQLYVGSGQSDGGPFVSAGTTLLTSTAATVNLKMNDGTNKVTAWFGGANPTSGKTVTYIYRWPTLRQVSGNGQNGRGQEGAVGARLEEPFVVRLQDSNSANLDGQWVTFPVVTGSQYLPVTRTVFRVGASPSGPGTVATDQTAAQSAGMQVQVKTQNGGVASIFFVPGSSSTVTPNFDGVRGVNVTNTLGGPDPFIVTATTRILSTRLTKESGDNQSAGVGQPLSEPLVVLVRFGEERRQNVPVRFTATVGSLVTTSSTNPLVDSLTINTNARGLAEVDYIVGGTTAGASVTASIGQGTSRREVRFSVNGGPGSGPSTQQQQQQQATNTITISPSTIDGEPGEEVTIRVTSSPSGVFATLGSNDFGATRFSPQSDVTPFTSTLLLPVEEGTHSFFATGGVLTAGRASVTVEVEQGRLSITAIGTPDAGSQTFSISAVDADGDRASAPFTARLSGTGFTSRNVEIADGRGNARVTLPTAASLYTLTVSATGYEDGETPVRIAGTGQQQVADEDEEEVEEEVTVAAEPDSIEITGPSTRSGTVNEELDTPLLVRVLDDDGDGLEGARVFYRVSSGRGRLSARGNGRAIGVVTDDDGYARASFTPLDGGTITVRANTDDLSATVEFTITTGSASSASGARDSGTGGTPGTISPVVHVGAASRPPMLWVDGGAIYALVGASPQRFAPGVDNALNITVGGGKVYWTEKTGESGGTINSANLNGSDVTELTSIKAVPMGIAVDVAGSKLYWTNSRGRIQSADLDGSGITNVIPGGLDTPMDLALAGGNAYWTQGNGSVRFVNLRGTKQIRNISTGTDTPGSLVIGGGKVYWTEMTGDSSGTIKSANLNGTDVKELTSIQAVPSGIAVDTVRSKLYWTNSRGRVQSANLDGSKITNVVSGLGSPGELVLSNSITAPAAAPAETASGSKYDVNGDGTVDNADSDAVTVAIAAGATDAKYDVNGDGTVNVFDLVEIIANRDPGAAGAPTLFGMKMSAAQIDSLQEQIDLLIAANDRSPAALRTLIYLQQLLVTARPEKTQLLANYPNPFNPETWIPYELATDTDVRITIYNTQGVVIRTLQLGHQSAGYYTGRDRAAYWDGRNALGEQVASGLYFYQLETDEMSLMRKMVILK